MPTSTRTFTSETAREFDRYSVANAVTLKEALPCGCEPYRDVFTVTAGHLGWTGRWIGKVAL